MRVIRMQLTASSGAPSPKNAAQTIDTVLGRWGYEMAVSLGKNPFWNGAVNWRTIVGIATKKGDDFSDEPILKINIIISPTV